MEFYVVLIVSIHNEQSHNKIYNDGLILAASYNCVRVVSWSLNSHVGSTHAADYISQVLLLLSHTTGQSGCQSGDLSMCGAHGSAGAEGNGADARGWNPLVLKCRRLVVATGFCLLLNVISICSMCSSSPALTTPWGGGEVLPTGSKWVKEMISYR